MTLVELQEKIKQDILDVKGNLNLDGLTLHIAMIENDISILSRRLEDLEIKNSKK